MARPRKYASEADAKAAKVAKRRQRRAGESATRNALKNDPTKRKDAAVNIEAYPIAPIDDATLLVIRRITEAAGEIDWSGRPKQFGCGRLAAALLAEWEAENGQRLPELDDMITVHGHTSNGVPITSAQGDGYNWNRLSRSLRMILVFMERAGANKQANERRDKSDQKRADAAGLSLTDFRTRREARAMAKHREKAEVAAMHESSAAALANRTARLEREGENRMRARETFGRF